jgi:hypothetical protein
MSVRADRDLHPRRLCLTVSKADPLPIPVIKKAIEKVSKRSNYGITSTDLPDGYSNVPNVCSLVSSCGLHNSSLNLYFRAYAYGDGKWKTASCSPTKP